MSLSVSSDLTNRVSADQVEMQSVPHVGGKIKQDGDNSATPMVHEATSQAVPTDSPTANGREVTGKPPNHKELEQMTEERLMEDPDYVKLKDQLAECDGLEGMFHLIDKNVGFRDDDKIVLDDILALVNDTNQPNKELRAAGKWLNDHREIWSAIAGSDNLVEVHDVKDFVAGLKAQIKGMRDAARADIKAENGIQAGAPAAMASQGGAATAATTDPAAQAAAADIMRQADQALPKPTPSQVGGLQGASENMGNMIGWGESEVARLSNLMQNTDDPKVLKQLELKINAMSQRIQQMAALMNQITTAMQNISKMYSEIAMNAVRNIR